MTDLAERRKKTVAAFYKAKGIEGLRELSAATGAKLSYLRQIMYSAEKPRPKIPSLPMAIALVAASKGQISFEGLAAPAA